MPIEQNYIGSVTKVFQAYKTLTEKAIAQLSDAELHWHKDEESNSIAIIVKHMAGNLLSRFSDFLTTDGEKPWRQRDSEFVDTLATAKEIMAYWEKGWACLFAALDGLTASDLEKTITIRGEPHLVYDALTRALAHQAHHSGQIVYIAKMLKGSDWATLSIPRGQSETFKK